MFFDDSSASGVWTDSLTCHWHVARPAWTRYTMDLGEVDRQKVNSLSNSVPVGQAAFVPTGLRASATSDGSVKGVDRSGDILKREWEHAFGDKLEQTEMQLLREEADRNTTTADGTLLNVSLCDWWVDADARDLVLEQKKISISEANRAFKLTDKNWDGELDLEECKEAFLDLDLVSDEADVEYYFEQLDVDQSGALGWDEFRRLSTDADVETLAGIDDTGFRSRTQRAVSQALTACSTAVSGASIYAAALAPLVYQLITAAAFFSAAAAFSFVCTLAINAVDFLWYRVGDFDKYWLIL